MLRSKTNSVSLGAYRFQPTKYDEDGNLYCALYRNGAHGEKCKVTILYKFNEETYDIIWADQDWISLSKNKKLLKFFLKQYDWV